MRRSRETSEETLPVLPLARGALDREGHRRTDPELLAGLLGDPASRVLELRDGRAEVVGHGSTGAALLLRGPEPSDGQRLAVYLGSDPTGTAYLGVVGEPADAAQDARTLREVGTDLDDRDAGLLTTMVALANWHAAHTRCPRCGQPTEPVHAGWVRRCPADGSEHYPRTDPAVIVAVVDDRDRLLLARGATWQPGGYSVLAGFVEPGEPLEAAVAREVAEEVGVQVTDVRYRGNQPWPFPSSLMVGFSARAVTTRTSFDDGEIVEARWFSRDDLAAAVADGSIRISGRLSIARALIEEWYGGQLTPPVEAFSVRG